MGEVNLEVCLLVKQQHPRSRQHHIQNRQRNQRFPSEVHQLVVAETRDRPADPHKDENKEDNLGEQYDRPHEAAQPARIDARKIVAAEINRGNDRTGNEHVDVFRKQVETEFHRTVFRVITADKFCFTFGHIEGCAVAFR